MLFKTYSDSIYQKVSEPIRKLDYNDIENRFLLDMFIILFFLYISIPCFQNNSYLIFSG